MLFGVLLTIEKLLQQLRIKNDENRHNDEKSDEIFRNEVLFVEGRII